MCTISGIKAGFICTANKTHTDNYAEFRYMYKYTCKSSLKFKILKKSHSNFTTFAHTYSLLHSRTRVRK